MEINAFLLVVVYYTCFEFKSVMMCEQRELYLLRSGYGNSTTC
jgi:hypothetical protein